MTALRTSGKIDRRPRLIIVSRRMDDRAADTRDTTRFVRMMDAVRLIGIEAVHVAISSSEELERVIAETQPDLAFCSFFRFGDEGNSYLRDFLYRKGIAWIGSTPDVLELALSKPRMKERWLNHEVPTPEWITVRKEGNGALAGLDLAENLRSFPYIVKPAASGNSRGIDADAVVRDHASLVARAREVAEAWGEALVERYVAGGPDSQEFTAAMIGNGVDAIVSAVELRHPAGETVITETDKRQELVVPQPVEDHRLRDRVENLARRAFMAAGVRDYARCDILLHEGTMYAIELNGQPIVPDSWFAACAAAAGLDERQYLQAIILAGIVGNARTGHAFISVPPDLTRSMPRQIVERLAH